MSQCILSTTIMQTLKKKKFILKLFSRLDFQSSITFYRIIGQKVQFDLDRAKFSLLVRSYISMLHMLQLTNQY
jgi:hypothetical protein